MKRNSRWSSLVGTFSGLLVLGSLLGAGMSGCEEQPPINRVQTLAVDKGLFTGSWYMTQTVIDVDYEVAAAGTFPGDSASDFGGSFSGVPRIRWVIDENFLYAYRDYEMIIGGDGEAREPGSFLGQPVAAYRITSHFDIKRSYNPTTGEELNVVEENTADRRWYERDYMRVDWSMNMLPGYYGTTQDLYEVLGLYRREPVPLTVQQQSDFPDSWRPRFDRMQCASDADENCKAYERDLANDYKQGELYHMSFVNQELLSPGNVQDPFSGGLVNFCLSPYSDAPGCTATAAYIRTSFLKVSETRQYEPVNWNDNRWSRAGYFRLEAPTWDRSTGSPDDPAWFGTDFLNYAINRYNLWKQWWTEDTAGNRTPIPFTDREVRQVVWYTTPELPAHLVKPSFDLVGQWNEILMETVRASRGQALPVYNRRDCQTTDPDGECFCQVDPVDGTTILNPTCEGRYDPFQTPAENQARLASGTAYDCHVVVPAGAEPDMNNPEVARSLRDQNFYGWYGAQMVGSECANVLRMNTCHRAAVEANGGTVEGLDCEERGDARFKFLSYVDQPGTPFLGIATLRGDPVTGETLFGDANIGGPALDGFRTFALQTYDLLNGNYTDQEFFTGEDVRGYFDALNQVQLPAPPRIDFNVAMRNLEGTEPLPAQAQRIRERMEFLMENRLERLSGPEGRANTFSDRIANLRDTETERRLTANWDTMALAGIRQVPAGYGTGNVPQGVLDRASPFRMNAPEMLARFDALETKIAKASMHMPNEYVDNSVAYFVQKHLTWPRARLEFELNRLLYRQTQVHEMGHCMGLRHDFGATADTKNYANDYYVIDEAYPLPDPRDAAFERDGVPGFNAAEQLAYEDAYKQARERRELAGIDGWMSSSIMDYTANWYQRLQPSGRYDHHALRMGYGDIVELGDNADGELAADANPINTPRVLFRWYQGGESCTVDTDCPYAVGGSRASELLQSNIDNNVTQRCVNAPRGGVKMCSRFDDDTRPSGPSPRWIPPDYRFCSDERAAGGSTRPGTIGWCNRFDEGDSYREIVQNTVENYERMYLFTNFRRYRSGFNIGGYLFDQLIGRRFVILQNIYQNLIYQYVSDPEFRNETGEFGFFDEFMATADILNFYARVLGQPNLGGYQYNARWKWFERASVDCQRTGTQLQVCLGKGRYADSVYQAGLSGIQRVERIGTFYDKLFTLQLMTLRGQQPGYTRDVPFYTNFYDLFPNEMQQIWNGMIRDAPEEYMPHVECSTFPNCGDARIIYNNFYRGDCSSADPTTCRPDPIEVTYAGKPLVNGGGSIVLQVYAAIYGLTEFPVFFDTTFQNQLFVCIEGQGDCFRPTATDVEGTDYVRYTSSRFGKSYLAWEVSPGTGAVEQRSIGFQMVEEARDLEFIVRMLDKYNGRSGGIPLDRANLTADELARLAALGYVLPTSSAETNREIDRLDGRLRDLESFFGQLIQLQREIGISAYLRF
jgi:hypothetical protein